MGGIVKNHAGIGTVDAVIAIDIACVQFLCSGQSFANRQTQGEGVCPFLPPGLRRGARAAHAALALRLTIWRTIAHCEGITRWRYQWQ